MTTASLTKFHDPRTSLIALSLISFLAVFVILQPLAALAFASLAGLLVVATIRPDWILYGLILALPLQGTLVLTYRANIKISELLGCVLILATAARFLVFHESIAADRRITTPLFFFLLIVLASTLNTPRFRSAMTLNQFMQPGIGRDAPDTRSYITALWGVYCALLLLSIPSVLRSSSRIYGAFRCFVWSGAAAAVFGIFDWIYLWQTGVLFDLPGSTQHANVVHSTAGGFPRSPGTFTEPSVYAFFLVLVMPVTLSLALGACPKILKRGTASLLFALEGIALLLSFSVSGYVVFAIVLSLFVFLATAHLPSGSVKWLLRRAMVGLMVIFLIFSVLQFLEVYPADVGDFVVQRLIGDADSAQIRFGLSRVAWDMAKDHYLTGVGIGNYPFLAMNYDAIRSVTMVELLLPTPSNLFLLFLAELGIVGTLAFFWLLAGIVRFFVSTIRQVARPLQLLHVSIGAAMAGSLVSFLFLDNLFVTYLWVVLGMSVALVRVSRKAPLSQPSNDNDLP